MPSIWGMVAAQCVDLVIDKAANAYQAKLSKVDPTQAKFDVDRRQLDRLTEIQAKGQTTGDPALSARGGTTAELLPGKAKMGAIDVDPNDACSVCALKHLSRASAFLNEAHQMLASYGFLDPSIQYRIDKTAENLAALEDLDWSPEKLARSEPRDRALVEAYYPRVRELRRDVLTTGSPEALETLAAKASVLSREYRIDFLKSRGLNMGAAVSAPKADQPESDGAVVS